MQISRLARTRRAHLYSTVFVFLASALSPVAVRADGHGGGGGGHHGRGGGGRNWQGFGGFGFYGGGFAMGGYMSLGFAPFVVANPVMVPVPIQPVVVRNGMGNGGLMLPQPGPAPFVMNPQAQPARPQPAKADNLVTLGDRLFRAKNTKKAEERYDQARRSNPKSATPLVRLAQLAIGRGDYARAADLFRDATITEPGWQVNAGDIQAIYTEPGDFAKAIAKLESHLQQSPNDRDGWLVLGAQLYLSGKTRQAGDVFRRLSDRKPDSTLAAFLDATNPDVPARQ